MYGYVTIAETPIASTATNELISGANVSGVGSYSNANVSTNPIISDAIVGATGSYSNATVVTDSTISNGAINASVSYSNSTIIVDRTLSNGAIGASGSYSNATITRSITGGVVGASGSYSNATVLVVTNVTLSNGVIVATGSYDTGALVVPLPLLILLDEYYNSTLTPDISVRFVINLDSITSIEIKPAIIVSVPNRPLRNSMVVASLILRNTLLQDSEITRLFSNRVFWDNAPDTTPFPYCVYHHISGGDLNDMFTSRDYDGCWRVYGHTDKAELIPEIMDAIYGALVGVKPVIPLGVQASGIMNIEEELPYKVSYLVQNNTLHVVGGEYRIMLSLGEI